MKKRTLISLIVILALLAALLLILPSITGGNDRTKESGEVKDSAAVTDTAGAEIVNDESSSETEDVKDAGPKFKIPDNIELTDSQRKAAERAEKQLDGLALSRSMLIKVLVDEGHSEEDAAYVADIFGIDWMEMARGAAEFETYYHPYSYQGLIDMLKYMEFTDEQAVYGADSVDVDWDSTAVTYIERNYLYGGFDDDGIIEKLEEAGYTHEQAVKGLEEYKQNMAEDSSIREEYGLDETGTLVPYTSEIAEEEEKPSEFNPRTIIVIAAVSIIVAGAIAGIWIVTKGPDKNKKNKKK